ncbi:substrate-binding domain-containing protein [Kitasatospora sp. NPDC094028]
MERSRVLGVLAALALLGGVTIALIPDDSKDPDPKPLPATVTVTGLIGSEKRTFFENADVKAELAKQGLVVQVDSTGSWTMREQAKSNPKLDFAFPSSSAPAQDIQRNWGLRDSPPVPFYSPLVIVTRESVAKALQQSALATLDPAAGVWTFRMDAYVAGLQSGLRWEDLPAAKGNAALSGRLLVTTTDPESSSSGALYLALLSYVANKHQVVSDDAGVAAVRDVLHTATVLQGAQKSSSDEPFRDFEAGVGRPLVFGYESQVATLPLQGQSTADKVVVMYPDTTVYSDHTMVARTPNGQKLASVLRDDDALHTLEAKFGFRTADQPTAFAEQTKDHLPKLAPDLKSANVKQADVPSLEYLVKLTKAAKGGQG